MSSKINLQTCEYARKSSIFQDNQLICLKDINETVAYLENCSEEDIYFISEVFEDVSEQLQSKEYIECLRKLDDKFPNLDMTIRWRCKAD